MKHISWIYGLLPLVWIGCSTQKNTWASRSFHEMKTEYNIYFNGSVSFEEGEKATRDANQDNYTEVLPLYPVSNHKAAESAASQMDRTIEKCRKCIKLHSIKARPKIDHRKASDPAYKQWLKQEEFNSKMADAWLLLGKAEFHKGDFLGSVSTFNYIIRHYQYNKDMVAQCQLWVVRAYGEMGWLYEAEDLLQKVQVDDLSRKHAWLFAAASADIKLKTKMYREAIPFIKIVTPNEKRKANRPRCEYILGQIYQMEGNREAALDAYQRVIGLHPSMEMDFNARLRRAQLNVDSKKALKELDRMARLDKYKERLDQLYGLMGDIYLAQADTVSALQYYEEAIAKSTRNGIEKASVLCTAGDLYFGRHQYVQAHPCYQQVLQIWTADQADYARVQRRSEALEDLVVAYTTVQLQDSLQRLALLTPEEQRAVVDKIIADLIQAEEAEKEKAQQAEREEMNNSGSRSVNTSMMLGMGTSSGKEWYFYNQQLLKNGRQTFQTQWGKRTLEDNWRRAGKTPSSSFEEPQAAMTDTLALSDSIAADSLALTGEPVAPAATETDDHKPEYYLQQIPRTEADFARSNELIADALFKMVYIYREKLDDILSSNAALQDFVRRFGTDNRLEELYYMQYLYALQEDRSSDADYYRQAIIQLFPQSDRAKIVSQPGYFDALKRMIQVQDSLYASAYQAYKKGEFETVKAHKTYMEENYPLTPLMPRFMFLDAVAQARTNGQEAFVAALQDMVNRYPENTLSAMAKDMLAMMGQGSQSQTGGALSSLEDKRTDIAQDEEPIDTTLQWNAERNAPSQVLLIIPTNEKMLNEMLYEVALFNFSQFMIKDFDLKQMPLFTTTQAALCVSGFDTMEEALWYRNMLLKNTDMAARIAQWNAQTVCITQENAVLLGKQKSLEDYLEWLNQQK